MDSERQHQALADSPVAPGSAHRLLRRKNRLLNLSPSAGNPDLSSILLDCCVTIGAVALAFLARKALNPWLGTSNAFITFFITVLLAAWLSGLPAAIVATVLGTAGGLYFIGHSPSPVAGASAFGVVCTITMFFAAIHRRAVRRAQEAAEALQLHQDELEREIAERKAVERSLRVAEERFRALSESNIIGIINLDAAGHITQANDAFIRMLGYQRDEFEKLKPHWTDLSTTESAERDEIAMRDLAEAGSFKPFERQYLHGNGTTRVPVMIGGARHNAPAHGGIAFVIDLTELSRAREALSMQSRVLESMAEGVVVTDTGGVVAFTNASLNHMFGYTREELLGRPIAPLMTLTDEERSDLVEEIRLALRVRGHWVGELPNRRKDGTTFTADATITEMRAPGHEYWICVQQDASERHAAEAALELAKEKAEAADRAKDQFLAVLSHELRTPLTPVLGIVQLLATDASLPTEVRDDLEIVRRNVELEARLIDDLLDLTRVARGKVELQMQPCDAHFAIRRAAEICQSDLEAKNLRLILNLGADQSTVLADPARLQQIVWNLLKNAIKFTANETEILVESSVDDGCICVRVTDQGIGIEPDAIGRIFDAFEQASRDIMRRYGGLGLGLAISKTLADLHGGRLEAASDGVDRGATFTLHLPLAVAQAAETKDENAQDVSADSAESNSTELLRILLVEDHLDTANALARLLSRVGHQVNVAANVAEALDLAGSQPFDLVISDLWLPDGNGHDLMRELTSRLDSIKGIALSGFGMESDMERSREAGFAEHLIKPVDLDRLENVIRRVTAEADRSE